MFLKMFKKKKKKKEEHRKTKCYDNTNERLGIFIIINLL